MLSTHTHKVKITQGQAAHSHRSRKKKQWSTAMIMHQICLHHISSLLWRKNTQLLICPTASFSLCLSLTHSPILSFIPAFTSLSFFFTSLSHSEICKQNTTFFFLKWIPVVNKIINTQAPLRNYLHKHQTLSRAHAQTNTHRRWTQY